MENMDLVMPTLNASEGGWDYVLAPSGTWQAVIFSVIDLGTQKEEYQGVKKEAHKIRIWFEFADDYDKIHTIYKELSLSFNSKSKLRQFVDGMNWGTTPMTDEQAKTFNVYTLLWKEATINVVHLKSKSTDNPYSDIASLSPRIKKIALHERKAKNTYLHLSEQFFNQDVFDSQPQFVREKIEQSPEAKKLFGSESVEEANEQFEKELEQAQQWKTIAQVEQSVAQARQEVQKEELNEIFGTTENMQ